MSAIPPKGAVSSATSAAPAVQITSSSLKPAVAVASAAGLIASIYNQSWIGGIVSSAGLALAYSMDDRTVQPVSAPPASSSPEQISQLLVSGLKSKSTALLLAGNPATVAVVAQNKKHLVDMYNMLYGQFAANPALNENSQLVANLVCIHYLATTDLSQNFSAESLNQNNLAVYAQALLTRLNNSTITPKEVTQLTETLMSKFEAVNGTIAFSEEFLEAVKGIETKIASSGAAAPQPASSAPASVQDATKILNDLNDGVIKADKAESQLNAVLDRFSSSELPEEFFRVAEAISEQVQRAAAASSAAAQAAARPVALQHTVQPIQTPAAPTGSNASTQPTPAPRRTPASNRPATTAAGTQSGPVGVGAFDPRAEVQRLRPTTNGVATGARRQAPSSTASSSAVLGSVVPNPTRLAVAGTVAATTAPVPRTPSSASTVALGSVVPNPRKPAVAGTVAATTAPVPRTPSSASSTVALGSVVPNPRKPAVASTVAARTAPVVSPAPRAPTTPIAPPISPRTPSAPVDVASVLPQEDSQVTEDDTPLLRAIRERAAARLRARYNS